MNMMQWEKDISASENFSIGSVVFFEKNLSKVILSVSKLVHFTLYSQIKA